jgi:hypothetical protein
MANAPPNLGDVITQADVSTKGAGSYAADYVSWARVAHLLHVHAPGWQFHLRPTADGSHVWQAPNGTAYVCGFFVGPDGDQTPLFPQAVMDNRNAPVAFAKVSARDLTDTHRRCLCTAAAATFGLAWQLWAKEPLEDPHRPAPPSHVELVAAARKACLAAGLTADGITALVDDASKGATTRLEELPAELLQRLARAGVSAETVARCNAAAEALVSPVDDEPPARWQEPASAVAA